MNKLFTLAMMLLMVAFSSSAANAQLSEKEKLEARRLVLKKTTELNALQILLDKKYSEQKVLKQEAEKAKAEAEEYAEKNQPKTSSDVKSADKLAKMVKKSSSLSNKLTKKNVEIEKTKAKIEKVKKELEKLNGSVIIYTDKEQPTPPNE